MKKIELINMALFEIGRECQIVDALRTESLRHIEVIEARGKEVPDTFRKLKADHEEMLNDIHHMLRDVMEEIGEYMNAHDIVQGVDVAINKAIYDLVYERKTEDDFEKEVTMEIIKVTVAKCGTNYAASLSDNVPGAVVLTADTYEELQQKAPEVLKFHVEGMIADGDNVPDWLRNGEYKFEYYMLP